MAPSFILVPFVSNFQRMMYYNREGSRSPGPRPISVPPFHFSRLATGHAYPFFSYSCSSS
jgi:hypothetical protein